MKKYNFVLILFLFLHICLILFLSTCKLFIPRRGSRLPFPCKWIYCNISSCSSYQMLFVQSMKHKYRSFHVYISPSESILILKIAFCWMCSIGWEEEYFTVFSKIAITFIIHIENFIHIYVHFLGIYNSKNGKV